MDGGEYDIRIKIKESELWLGFLILYNEEAKTTLRGWFYFFHAVGRGAARLKRICAALPRAPLKKLFEKSFFRIFKNFWLKGVLRKC